KRGTVVEQVRGLDVPEGHLAVWALGQSGFLLKGGGHVVVIDPYLSNYVEEIAPEPKGAFARRVPIVARPEELDMVDLALSTHQHDDHCDPKTLIPLMQAAPRALVLTSYRAGDVLLAAGADEARVRVPPVDTP